MTKVVHGVQPDDAWELNEALDFVRSVEHAVALVGWHVALTGGVLKRGVSDKDLDLVFYAHNSNKASVRKLRQVFRNEFKWAQARTCTQMRAWWRKKGSLDNKHVEVWRTDEGRGRRIDVIIPGIK